MALATRSDEDADARASRIIRLLTEVGGNEPASRIHLVLRDDRDGVHTATVLAAVAQRTWGAVIEVDQMWLQGISAVTDQDLDLAEREGKRWRLVASATPHCARVEPTKVPMGSALAQDYLADVVQVHLSRGGTLTLHASTSANDQGRGP